LNSTTKPLQPFHRRLDYFALMMIGVGLMLLAVAGDESRKERIATFVGLAFVVPGIMLLLVAGGLRWYRGQLEVETQNKTVQQNSNTEHNELTDMERAFIRLLRASDVPPDVVAQAIREILERRVGR
jgi:hypothetical protein